MTPAARIAAHVEALEALLRLGPNLAAEGMLAGLRLALAGGEPGAVPASGMPGSDGAAPANGARAGVTPPPAAVLAPEITETAAAAAAPGEGSAAAANALQPPPQAVSSPSAPPSSPAALLPPAEATPARAKPAKSGKPHWTQTASPERMQAHVARMLEGRRRRAAAPAVPGAAPAPEPIPASDATLAPTAASEPGSLERTLERARDLLRAGRDVPEVVAATRLPSREVYRLRGELREAARAGGAA